MIIADILTNPISLEKFSYFTDTRDTVNFLIWQRDVSNSPNKEAINQMIETLTTGYAKWYLSSFKK